MTKTAIIIPARMASTRLPNKPMADIGGKPMIIHVAERAKAANLGQVVVATDDVEIKQACEAANIHAVMTRSDHPSGTDRIAEAVEQLSESPEIIINLQGDLPLIDPEIIQHILLPFETAEVDMTTLVTPITDAEEHTNPNVVKAIMAWREDTVPQQGRALYFTRATAPFDRDGEGVTRYHHIGIYAYRRSVLQAITQLPPSPLEQAEKLEQLRVLEAGYRIDAVECHTMPLGVDTAEDLQKVRKAFAKQ